MSERVQRDWTISQVNNAPASAMESQMESIDISSIQAAVLRPIESQADLNSDAEPLSSSNRLRAIQNIFQQSVAATYSDGAPLNRHLHHATTSQAVNTSASCPDLPSTVPDSQAIAHVEQILQEIPDASVPQVMQILKKMNSQGVPQDTQPLSPEFLASIISKSRRIDPQDEETDVTHATLYPGDEGHIDLLSSYQLEEIRMEEREEFEPAVGDFSPTQAPPQRLSQFPESQRFKTPATVGKKRKHNGDLVESPLLPRNPLARNTEPTPGKGMGLSQIFAATQAPSSPFINGLPSELRSDRPSPTIALQQRPMSATDSSPLQRRSLPPRSSIEPQTKYISVEESQARREARERMQNDNADDEEQDSFDETLDEVRRRREKKRRDQEAERQFAALDFTSPVGPRSRGLRSHSTSPPEIIDDIINESEEETDQEDGDQVAVRHSSQLPRRPVSEDDKENVPLEIVLIPETIAPHRTISGYSTEVQASPSVGHGDDAARSRHGSQRMENRESVVVAHSQRSEARRHILSAPNLVSSGDQTDFVPQSQYPSNSSPGPGNGLAAAEAEKSNDIPVSSHLTKRNQLSTSPDNESVVAKTARDAYPNLERQQAEQDEEEPPRRGLRSQLRRRSFPNTIPETNSSRPSGSIGASTDHPGETAKSLSEFETAPSHFPTSSNEHESAPAALPSQAAMSSSPVQSKRKRMDQIDAEESQRSNGPDLGELNPMLIDDEYNDIMRSSSPILPRRNVKKCRVGTATFQSHELPSSSPLASSTKDRSLESKDHATPAEQELRTTQGETPPASSDEILAPNARHRGLRRPKEADETISGQAVMRGKGNGKPSTWDIQDSPERPPVTRSGHRTQSLRKPSSTIPPVQPRRSPAPRQRIAATQAAKTSTTRIETPLRLSPRHSRSKSHPPAAASDINPPTETSEIISTPACTAHDRSAPPGDVLFPNQVFACYNGKSRAYYPAACVGVSNTETLRYQIQWDGYEPDELDEHGVRSLDLRHGDVIKLNLEGFPKIPHLIRGFKDMVAKNENAVTDIRGYKTLLVTPKQRKSLPAESSVEPEDIKEAPVSTIYLDSNMWNQMKDRPFTYTAPPSLLTSKYLGLPTQMENSSTPSTPRSRNRRLHSSAALPAGVVLSTRGGCFSNMAFAISYGDEVRRTSLTKVVLKNGGLILNSGFHELFLPDSITLKPQYVNLGFTALLADKHSIKEKYLQALALALPCLSGKWVEACTSSDVVVDWQSYLLPAGESSELDGAVRSRTLTAYEPATTRIAEVIQSRPEMLESAHVTIVLGHGKVEEKRKALVFLAHALGAGHVETVPDITTAKLSIDRAAEVGDQWLFVDDQEIKDARELFAKKSGRRGSSKNPTAVRVVGNEFVKQSLILGSTIPRLIN